MRGGLFRDLGLRQSDDIDEQDWLHAEMLRRYHVGMLQKLLRLFSRQGLLVKGAAKLDEGTARTVDIGDPLAGGKQVLLCKVDGDVYALDAYCPHDQGGRIQPGPLEHGKFAICPLHRYMFDPKTGKPEGVACASARRYKTKQAGDDVEIFV